MRANVPPQLAPPWKKGEPLTSRNRLISLAVSGRLCSEALAPGRLLLAVRGCVRGLAGLAPETAKKTFADLIRNKKINAGQEYAERD
jgi:hypothetical protein